jgi:hypothetical protein
MARDIILGENPANWSRDGEPAPATSVRGKVALGGMALGTALGLALVTSPWWSRRFTPASHLYRHTDYSGVRLPRRAR